jgi:hypothetical protein
MLRMAPQDDAGVRSKLQRNQNFTPHKTGAMH